MIWCPWWFSKVCENKRMNESIDKIGGGERRVKRRECGGGLVGGGGGHRSIFHISITTTTTHTFHPSACLTLAHCLWIGGFWGGTPPYFCCWEIFYIFTKNEPLLIYVPIMQAMRRNAEMIGNSGGGNRWRICIISSFAANLDAFPLVFDLLKGCVGHPFVFKVFSYSST